MPLAAAVLGLGVSSDSDSLLLSAAVFLWRSCGVMRRGGVGGVGGRCVQGVVCSGSHSRVHRTSWLCVQAGIGDVIMERAHSEYMRVRAAAAAAAA